MRRRSWLAASFLSLAVVAGAARALMPLAPAPGDPGDARQVDLGRAVYGQACARCHGDDLGGEFGWIKKDTDLPAAEVERMLQALDDVAPAHDKSGLTWRLGDDMLFRIIRDGPASALSKPDSRMPAFDQLSDQDIWAVIAFMKSHWSEESS